MPAPAALRSHAADLHAAFLAELPRFDAHARYATRHIACPDTRADLVAEIRRARPGGSSSGCTAGARTRGSSSPPSPCGCSQAVRAGRRLVRSDSARDALSPVARARHGFAVERLPHPRCDVPHLAEALADNTRTPVPEQAAFRLDYPRWRAGFRPRTRAVLDALAVGERTGDVARRFGISFRSG